MSAWFEIILDLLTDWIVWPPQGHDRSILGESDFDRRARAWKRWLIVALFLVGIGIAAWMHWKK